LQIDAIDIEISGSDAGALEATLHAILVSGIYV
jgi:hypothetical protein